MIQEPMDVLRDFPVRKGKKKKAAFRNAAAHYLSNIGYECCEEKGSMGSVNLIAGDPAEAKYLITAHYDTCAAMPFPNLITPCNFLLFLLYQLLVTALLFVPAVVVAIAVGYLTSSFQTGYLAGYSVLILVLVLMYIGPANKNNVNDNTSGVIALLEIARSLPQEHRSKVCFVLFDLEEAGLVGSSSYRDAHKKEIINQLVFNLDCIGDGNEIRFFPTKKLRKNLALLASLEKCSGMWGKKSITVQSKGFCVYPSDQKNFPYGVGICALRKGRLGLYLGRIHTRRDIILEKTNVNILRACLISYITCTAVDKKG